MLNRHKKKFVIYGNCQALPLSRVFQLSLRLRRYFKLIIVKPIHVLTEADRRSLYQILSDVDIFLHQPIGDHFGCFSISAVKKILKPSCLCISMPVCYFTGYGPETVTIKDDDTKTLNNFCDYHDFNIIGSFVNGETIDQCVANLKNPMYYEKSFVENNAENSLISLKDKERDTDIAIHDYIAEHWRNHRLFNSVNHCSNRVLFVVVNRVLDHLGLKPLSYLERLPNIEYLANTVLPVYRSISGLLSFDSGRPVTRVRKKRVTLKEYVTAYYFLYKASPTIVKNNYLHLKKTKHPRLSNSHL